MFDGTFSATSLPLVQTITDSSTTTSYNWFQMVMDVAEDEIKRISKPVRKSREQATREFYARMWSMPQAHTPCTRNGRPLTFYQTIYRM
jgi:hypothetical protein